MRRMANWVSQTLALRLLGALLMTANVGIVTLLLE